MKYNELVPGDWLIEADNQFNNERTLMWCFVLSRVNDEIRVIDECARIIHWHSLDMKVDDGWIVIKNDR